MNEKTPQHITDLIGAVERLTERFMHEADQSVEPYRRTAFSRFPFLFTLLGVIGAAAVVHGSNKMLDRVPFFTEHPLALIAVGLLILVLTGTLYKRLS